MPTARQRRLIDRAIQENAQPAQTRDSVFLRTTQGRVLIEQHSQATAAGRLWHERQGTNFQPTTLPRLDYTRAQEQTKDGLSFFIQGPRGKVWTRRWNKATGEQKLTKAGMNYLRLSELEISVLIPLKI